MKVVDYLNKETIVNSVSSVHLSKCEFTLSMSNGYLDYLEQLQTGSYYKGETQ